MIMDGNPSAALRFQGTESTALIALHNPDVSMYAPSSNMVNNREPYRGTRSRGTMALSTIQMSGAIGSLNV